jgi:hypothetical protein
MDEHMWEDAGISHDIENEKRKPKEDKPPENPEEPPVHDDHDENGPPS